MKNRRFAFIAFLFTIMIFASVVTEAKDKTPFKIKIVEKPKDLISGKSYSFVFEIKNVSGAPLTLSSACGAGVNFAWTDGNKGGGTGSGCGMASFTTSTDYDPATGKFSCITRTYTYTEANFFTLQPDETKIFKIETTVPKDIPTKDVTAIIEYNSQYDGKEIGIKAWKGTSFKNIQYVLKH